MSDNRDVGIEFGALTADLATETYPLSRRSLIDRYGDRELEHANGTTTVSSVVGSDGPQVFAAPEDVHQSLLNFVGTEAVGRERYSDRGGATPDERTGTGTSGDTTSPDETSL